MKRLIAFAVAFPVLAIAQDRPLPAPLTTVPRVAAVPNATSELVNLVERYASDQAALNRRYDAFDSPARRTRMRQFYTDWRARLREADFDRLSQEGKVDYVLLDNQLQHEIALLDRRDRQRAEEAPVLPFADRLLALQDARRDLKDLDNAAAARALADVAKQVDSLRALFEQPARGADSSRARASAPRVSRTVANRAADNIESVRRALGGWYRFYNGYDPMFTWWAQDPYRKVDSALMRYSRTLRERVVGMRPGESQERNQGPIIGDPIGAVGLQEDLRHEMIAYSPERS